ncbi:hypothetical protein IJT10_08105 [bacterium]|nr:hypothetical protein [bacterium]
MDKIYIDGFNQVHFVNNMVRINMFTYKGQNEGEALEEDAGELILNPQGFIQALNAMQQLAERMTEVGILQRSENSPS